MIIKFCAALLIALSALPAYAGHGTIRETDSQIIVEYFGDHDEIETYKVQKAEEEKLAALEAQAKERIQLHNQQREERRAARRAERSTDDE